MQIKLFSAYAIYYSGSQSPVCSSQITGIVVFTFWIIKFTSMHAQCFPIGGKSTQFLSTEKLQFPPKLQCRHFNAQIVTLRNFAPCRCSADTPASPLPPPPNLKGKAPRKFWNAASLAFLGDSVWEVWLLFLPLLLFADSLSKLFSSLYAALYKTEEFLSTK